MKMKRVKKGADASSVTTGVDASSVTINNSATLGSVASYAENSQLLFMEKDKFISIKGSKLPHWHQTDKVQFVTFRLADSLPQAKLSELLTFKKQWLTEHPEPWDNETREEYNHKIRMKVDRWLDQGYGECILERGEIREIVENALLFHNGKRYRLHHFVIMPNHVHLLLSPIGDDEVVKSIGSVKQFSANAINKRLGRRGNVWQRNVFDRLVRDMQSYEACVNYINHNPCNLRPDQYTLGADASSVK
ncbi:MAG: transposase [Bacteroidales bacterium]|nr:transposase [Bacteroidales bacterium]